MTERQAGKLKAKAVPMAAVVIMMTARSARPREAKTASARAAAIIAAWVTTMTPLRLRRSAREPA